MQLTFKILILYPNTLMNFCISSDHFLVGPLGFSVHKNHVIMSISPNRVFLLPFQSGCLQFSLHLQGIYQLLFTTTATVFLTHLWTTSSYCVAKEVSSLMRTWNSVLQRASFPGQSL